MSDPIIATYRRWESAARSQRNRPAPTCTHTGSMLRDGTYVIIRPVRAEYITGCRGGHWVAPKLPDGTLGKLTTTR